MTNPFERPAEAPAPAPAPAPAQSAAPQQFANPFPPQGPAQYAPQGPAQYAPQGPAQYAPQGPTQYAPQGPAQYAPQGPAQQAPALDPSRLSAAPVAPPSVEGGGLGAKLPDMYGRLLLIFPQSIETRARNPQYITAEQRQQGRVTEELLTATVVVLDSGEGSAPGGHIDFGGAPYAMPPTPHTSREPLPYVRRAMWITQSRLVGQLRGFLPQPGDGSPRMAAGRLFKAGPEHNSPWELRSATQPELDLCQAYLRLVTDGRYPHPLG